MSSTARALGFGAAQCSQRAVLDEIDLDAESQTAIFAGNFNRVFGGGTSASCGPVTIRATTPPCHALSTRLTAVAMSTCGIVALSHGLQGSFPVY